MKNYDESYLCNPARFRGELLTIRMKPKLAVLLLLSLPVSTSALEYRFDYDLDSRTKRWTNIFLYEESLPGLRFDLKGRTYSSLFSSPGVERRERFRFLGVKIKVPLKDQLFWTPFFAGTELEVRGQGRREARAGAGIELKSGRLLSLSFQGGGVSLRRDEGSPLSGLTYALRGEIKLSSERKVVANLKFERRKETLKMVPKRGSSLIFQMGLENWGIKNGISILDSLQERNYFLEDSTGGRRDKLREARFNSQANLIGGFQGDLSLFRSQGVTFRRGGMVNGAWEKVVEELRDGFSLIIRHPLGNGYRLSFFYRYLEGTDDYEGELRDERLESGELGGVISWVPFPADSMELEGFAGLRSVNTPAQSNYDDRDEANRFLQGYLFHRLTPFLHLKVRGRVGLEKQVYIWGRRSANNNSVTLYSLAPETIWRIGEGFSLSQGFRLKARYQIYQWAQSQEGNNLLRSVESESGLGWRMSNRLKGEIGYLHKWEDYGKLRWEEEWIERLSWKRTSSQLRFSFSYLPGKGFRLTPSCVYRLEREWIPEISPLGEGWELSEKERRLRLSLEGGLSLGRQGLLLLQGSRWIIGNRQKFDYLNLSINLFY